MGKHSEHGVIMGLLRKNQKASEATGPFIREQRVDPSDKPASQEFIDKVIKDRGEKNVGWVLDEWRQLGSRVQPMTEKDLMNWTKHGRPGQILTELGGGVKMISDDKGKEYKVFTDLKGVSEDNPFNFGHDGDLVAVPKGTPLASGWKIAQEDENSGYQWIYKKPRDRKGVLNYAADATGIKELATWLPQELYPLLDIYSGGTATGILSGTKGVKQRDKQVEKHLGIKAKEFNTGTQVTGQIASWIVSPVLPYAPAVMTALQGANAKNLGADISASDVILSTAIAAVAPSVGKGVAKFGGAKMALGTARNAAASGALTSGASASLVGKGRTARNIAISAGTGAVGGAASVKYGPVQSAFLTSSIKYASGSKARDAITSGVLNAFSSSARNKIAQNRSR
jgi:hypothetical protein